jgi:hypothetical protein
MSVEPVPEPFKICGACKVEWPTWESFVVDPTVKMLGLQAVVTDPDINLLVFEHDCGSTVSILSKRLRHLLPDAPPDAPTTRQLGTETCRGHCLMLADLAACDAPCSNARERDLVRIVQKMKTETLTENEA